MLYSALPYEYQHLIFTPDNSVEAPRRVILATNIA
jgi:HrpA-like RNA helicase